MPDDPAEHNADLSLVQRAQAGDLDAYDSLVAKHQTMIAGILYRFSADRAELEDLVQDTFLRAWKALPRLIP